MNSGVGIGAALSSVSILQIASFGWRNSFAMTGAVGMIVGFAILFLVKDPQQLKKQKTAINTSINEDTDDQETSISSHNTPIMETIKGANPNS